MPRIEDYEAAIGGPVETIAEQSPEALTPEAPAAPQYEQAITAMRDEQKQTVQGALFAGQKSDPERRAKAIELSKQIHMPADFVERHYDELAKEAAPKLDVDSLIDQNPRVSKYLESIDNAALSHDDLEPLRKIEDGHNAFTYAGDLTNAAKTGFRQLEASGYNGAALYGLHNPDELAVHAAESNRIAKSLRAQAPDYVTEFHKAWEQPGKTFDEKTREFRKTVTALADGFTLDKLKAFGKEGAETAQDLAELLYVAAQRPKATSYIIAENLANSLPTLALEAAGTVGGAYAGAYAGAAMGTAAGPFGSIVGLIAGAGIGAMAGRGGASFVGNFATEVGGYVNEELEKSGVDITDPQALAAAYKNPVLMTRIRGEAERKGLTIATTSALFAGLAGKFTAAGNSLPSKVARAGTEVAVGGLEEGTGEYLGDAAAKQDFDKSSAANAALEGVAGMGQAAGTVGMSVATDALSAVSPGEKKSGGTTPPSGDPVKAAQEAAAKYIQAKQVLDQGESLMKAAEAVRESKTIARMPEKIAELIDGEAPSSHVYFQSDAWDAYWISKGLSPVTMANELTGDGGQAYQNAKDTGAPLEISMGQYLAKIAPTEHLEGLFPATRTTPDGMTFQEAKEFDQQLPTLMQSIAQEAQALDGPANSSENVAGDNPTPAAQKAKAQASARQVEKQIHDQLVQAGMSSAEAKQNAQLTASVFRALGERSGLDPAELFAQYGLNVQGAEQQPAAAPGDKVMEQGDVIEGNFGRRPRAESLPPLPANAGEPAGQFKVGDIIFHKGHGAGRVAGLIERENGRFYSLTIRDSGSDKTVFVPEAQVNERVSTPLSKEQGEALRASLSEPSNPNALETSWNRRYRDHMEHLASGDVQRIAQAYRELRAVAKTKDLSFGERKLLEQATTLLNAQLEASTGKGLEEERTYDQSNLPAVVPSPDLSPLGFYSQLQREVQKMDFKAMPAKDLAGRIKNLPGIKAEELEFTGFMDFLEMRAAEAGTSEFVVQDSSGAAFGMPSASKEAAEQTLAYWKASPAHQGVALEIRETKLDGKVSKEEVTAFLKENGVKVEQVMLAESYRPPQQQVARPRGEGFNGKPGPDDLSWDEGTVLEPDSDMLSDRAYERLREDLAVGPSAEQRWTNRKWIYEYEGAEYQAALKRLESGFGFGEQVLDKDQELRDELTPDFTDAEGNVDEKALDVELRKQLERFIDNELSEQAYNQERDSYYEDEDYAEMKYRESETGYDLIGRHGDGEWYCPDNQKSYSGSLEEAKIKLLADMIDEGVVVAFEPVPADEVEFTADTDAQGREFLILDHADFTEGVIGREVDDGPIMLRAEVAGSPELETQLAATTLEAAQEEALAKLADAGLITGYEPKQKKVLAAPEPGTPDPNAPTGRTHWNSHTVPGGTNYREILLTLPELDGTFTYDAHWRGQKNVLAHIRVSDRLGPSLVPAASVPSSADKMRADRLAADAKTLSDVVESQSLQTKGVQGLDAQDRKSVVASVLSAIGDDQVRKSIVESVPVDVMNDLVAAKLSPESFFNDQTMLSNSLAGGDPNAAVQLGPRSQAALVRAVADLAAKESARASELVRLSVESGSAPGTGDVEGSHRPSRILFIEELQSDLHQQGRERGYQGDAAARARLDQLPALIAAQTEEYNAVRAQYAALDDDSASSPEGRALGKRLDEIGTAREALIKEQYALQGAVPNAPYKQTEAWAALAMKRMLRLAVEQGYDQLAWSPAEVHVDRWGTDSIGWVKREAKGFEAVEPDGKTYELFEAATLEDARRELRSEFGSASDAWTLSERKPHFLVGAVEQQGGNADGVDIEGLARMRGQLLERRGQRITTKEELHNVIASVLHRERNERSLESLTDQLWKEMQEKETGAKFPRKEGMEFFYDNALPRKVVPGILKKLDKEAKVTATKISQGRVGSINGVKDDILEVWAVPLTPKLKEEISKGFTLFQEGQNDPRGRIRFGKHSVSIDLLKNADRSTLQHELGHFYLEVLGDLATADGASEQLKKDYAAALAWFGVTDRKDIKTEHHEQWARGFEAYLMEGKAPTPALREAFARFKTWLIEIYRELRNLNVELTPEIRQVFDRLVATEEEIAEAQGGLSPPLFENPEAFGMTGPKAEAYKAALERARVSAEEELTRKAMAEIREREGTEFAARREEVEFQVRAQVDVLPVYRALDKLQDKASGLKVQREGAITTMGFKKLPESLTRYRGMFSDDGVHPDILAEGFGFENGEQMLNALATAKPKEDLVSELTEQRMKTLYPGLFDEGRMQAEAEAAVRNEDRAKVLRLELQHLASNDLQALKEGVRRVTRRVPPPKAVKAQAARILGAQAVRDIKPHLYEKAERAAGKEAGEALAKGDFERAFDAKQRELLNNALYRASLAAKETVRKSVADFKKFKGVDADIATTREMDYVNTGRAILAAFGLGPQADKPVDTYLGAIQRNDSDTYQTVQALYDSATQRTGQFPAIAFDDFVAMRDSVQALWELAKDTRELDIDGRKVELATAKGELIGRIGEMAPPSDRDRPGLDRKIEDNDRFWYGVRGIMSRLRRVESWVDEMDGGNLSGAFRKYFWTPVSEAIGRYRDARKVTLEKYLALVKQLDGLTGKAIVAKELNDAKPFTFKDKAHLLGAMLHTGNLSNKSKLVGGMKWGGTNEDGEVDFQRWDAFVARMHSEGILTKADYDFLQSVWDLFEEQKPLAQKVHKKLYGFYFNEITADEVVTPFGAYRGGYVPAIADSEVVEDAAVREEKNNLEKANNSFMFPTAGRGFTKKRVEQYMAPLIMDLRFVPQQLDRVLRFVHIEPAVKQAGRIAVAQDFRKALATVDPTAGAEMLVPWLQRAAQQMVETPMEGWGGKATAKFFRKLRSHSGMQVMFANVTNTMQQFTGITIAAVKVKPRHLRNSLWSYVRAPGQLAKEAGELSELMRSRMDHQMSEMRETLNELLVDPTKYEQALKFAQKNVYFLQSATQNVVDVVVWHGAYDQAVEEGLSQQDAVRAADSAVRLTQGSMAPEDISRFETGNAFVRAFTMFYSYFNMQANLLGTEFANTWREQGLRKGAPRLLYVYAMGFLVPAMLSEVLVRAMSGKGLDEDDDDQYMDDVLADFFLLPQIRNGTAMFPVAGQIANAGINALDNKWYNDRISTSPAISMLETSIGGTFKIGQKLYAGEDINGKRATRDLLTLLGLLSGLPLAPLSRPIGYGIDLATGDAEPRGDNALLRGADMTRGFITGKSGKQK